MLIIFVTDSRIINSSRIEIIQNCSMLATAHDYELAYWDHMARNVVHVEPDVMLAVCLFSVDFKRL